MREAVAGFYDGTYARDLLTLALFVVPALLIGIAVRQRLLGVNALFDRRMAELLRARGLEAMELRVESHGERNLLVATPDATAEPRNRRVEVLVR